MTVTHRRRIGLVLVAVAVFVMAANRAAGHIWPDEWGGPNIGAGFIDLVALVVVASGLWLAIRGRIGTQ